MASMHRTSPTGRTDSASIVVAAPCKAVYRAFADATTLMAWLPPTGMTGRALEYDFREGGRYRIELTYVSPGRVSEGKTTERTDVTAIARADHDAGLRSSLENLARHLATEAER
jgi:uncharacterized protein YndB with AHSA1/START domain